jgi:transposase
MVARRHDINANVVFAWRSQYRSGKLALPESGVVEAPRPANTELRQSLKSTRLTAPP